MVGGSLAAAGVTLSPRQPCLPAGRGRMYRCYVRLPWLRSAFSIRTGRSASRWIRVSSCGVLIPVARSTMHHGQVQPPSRRMTLYRLQVTHWAEESGMSILQVGLGRGSLSMSSR